MLGSDTSSLVLIHGLDTMDFCILKNGSVKWNSTYVDLNVE